MFGKKEKRFKKKSVEGLGFGEIQIVADTVTGVNYLVVMTGAAPTGITPLLDEYGNVVVDKLD